MGLFDYVNCKYPLPEAPEEIQNAQFQTKSFDHPYMETYVIEADGRLLYYGTESTPEGEQTYPDAEPGSLKSLAGILRRKKDPEVLTLTESVRFYTSTEETDEWFEYVALFIKGKLVHIERIPDPCGEKSTS